MRRTVAKRPGQPCALSGRAMTANLDQVSFDRLTWARHVTRRLLKAEAGTSVLIRRAIALYTDHMERLLAGHRPEELERETNLLSTAARGCTEAIPEEELIAVPLRPFSDIRRETEEARAEARRAALKESLAQDLANLTHEAKRRGHDF